MSSPKFIPIEERVPILVGEGWHRALRRSLEILLGLPEIRRRVDQAREQVAQFRPPASQQPREPQEQEQRRPLERRA